MTIFLSVAALFYNSLLALIFFKKRKINSKEITIYSYLIIVTLFSLIVELVIPIMNLINSSSGLVFFLKLLLICILVWTLLIYLYVYFLFSRGKLNKKFLVFFFLINIICIFFIMFLPIEFYKDGNIAYSYGQAVEFVYMICKIYVLLIISTILLDYRNIKSKKYYPLYVLIILLTISSFIQMKNPEILLTNFVYSFVLFVMYFTIENPDVKMINQLLRNQEIVEEQMEGKSRFLFEMSQDIKQPTNNILGVVNTYDELSSVEKEEAIKIIGDNANELLFKLNNVLNVSSMDASKIKIINEEYNPKILLNGIKSMASNAIGEKQIKLNFEVSESLPNKLSGDDVRLKQIIMSVLYNCINHTETGVINVNVDSIVRYDVARLLIRIEDTGIGMDLDTINKIIDDNQELNKMDIEKLDKLDVDLKVAIKIIKLLGGNIMIKSDKGRGSTFDIVINQKCEMENLANSKELEKYTSDAFGKKRVLVVDDNKDELFKISDILGKKDININTSMIGKECVDRIRSGELYNLIIIDDELKITSGYSVLKELNELDKFKIPVIIMLEKDKEHLKEHYIEDGFKDVILKENLTEELDRISNSYL